MSSSEVAPTPTWELAPVRFRIVAWFVDLFVVWLVPALIGAIYDQFATHTKSNGTDSVLVGLVLAIVFSVIFSTLMELIGVAKWGRTLGKAGVGLRISRSTADYIKLTKSQVFVRFAAKAGLPLLLIAYGVPYLFVVWLLWMPTILISMAISKTNQGFDDKLAKTYVIRKQDGLRPSPQ